MAPPARTRALVVASIVTAASTAGAQDPPAPPPAKATEPAAAPVARPMNLQPAAMQSQGAKRGPNKRGPLPRHRGKRGHGAQAPVGAPIVQAPTFQRLDDGSTRISVEVATKVEVGTNHPQGRLVFRLKDAIVIERVNLLPVITTYFATPVDRAQLAQVGPDVDLVIDLRESTTPSHRVVETQRGMVLQVDFPRVARDEPRDNAPSSRDNAPSSRDNARRRQETQSLGTDHKPGDGN